MVRDLTKDEELLEFLAYGLEPESSAATTGVGKVAKFFELDAKGRIWVWSARGTKMRVPPIY